jgi:hypothetical protein
MPTYFAEYGADVWKTDVYTGDMTDPGDAIYCIA